MNISHIQESWKKEDSVTQIWSRHKGYSVGHRDTHGAGVDPYRQLEPHPMTYVICVGLTTVGSPLPPAAGLTCCALSKGREIDPAISLLMSLPP